MRSFVLCHSAPPQETIEKTDANGKILPEMVRTLRATLGHLHHSMHQAVMCQRKCHSHEMQQDLSSDKPHWSSQILICQNLRNNLQHPNEYLRGATLRFLCRIKEEEILEPLTPSILVRAAWYQ